MMSSAGYWGFKGAVLLFSPFLLKNKTNLTRVRGSMISVEMPDSYRMFNQEKK